MIHNFDNDKIGLSWAAEQASKLLAAREADPLLRLDALDELTALNGPHSFQELSGLKRWHVRMTNRLLWRQHAFNARLITMMRHALTEEIRLSEKMEPSTTKPLLAWLVPFDASVQMTGGAVRIVSIARQLARHFRIRIISVVRTTKEFSMVPVYPDVDVVCVPYSKSFLEKVDEKARTVGQAALLFALAEDGALFPELKHVFKLESLEAAAIFVNTPAFMPLLREVKTPIVYEAHDVHDTFVDSLAETNGNPFTALESELCNASKLIVSVSDEDKNAFIQKYNIPAEHVVVVPNGVETEKACFLLPEQSRELRLQWNITSPVVLFVGSMMKANLDAMHYVMTRVAPQHPDVNFVHLGVSREDFKTKLGIQGDCKNVMYTGRISDSLKEGVFALADLAISPLFTGTGTSLKIPDYLAHGKIVISTAIGMRGFSNLEKFVFMANETTFAGKIGQVLDWAHTDMASLNERAKTAHAHIQQTLDWSIACQDLPECIQRIVRYEK